MRGSVARRALSGAVGVFFLLLSSACAVGAADTGELPVPTFPAPATAGPDEPGTAVPEDGLPAECGTVLAAGDLEALLGLPLASVGVRTVIGQPSPSVGRTERVTCSYTTSRAAGDLAGRAPLLDINASTYTSAEAAADHWWVNVAAGDVPGAEMPIGAAPAVLLDGPGNDTLMVLNGTETVTLVLPDEVRVGDRTSAETLVDLALRVLPAVSGPAGAPASGSATPQVLVEAAEARGG